jgi:hypothetical protein
LGSRPDRFCPFAIVSSNRHSSRMMMRYSHIKWLVPAYSAPALRWLGGEKFRAGRL